MSLSASPGLPIPAAEVGFVTGTLNLGTYATGGIAVTGSQVNCPNNLFELEIRPSGGYAFEYVPSGSSGGKIKAYWSGTASAVLNEVTNATNLGSINPRFTAIGY